MRNRFELVPLEDSLAQEIAELDYQNKTLELVNRASAYCRDISIICAVIYFVFTNL